MFNYNYNQNYSNPPAVYKSYKGELQRVESQREKYDMESRKRLQKM